MSARQVLLVTPHYDGTLHRETERSHFFALADVPGTILSSQANSFLTFQFNQLWCEALNDKSVTHWVMLHSDIWVQDEKWLSKLVEMADAQNADVLSVVSPIKNMGGLTSTGLARGNDYGDFRRVTIKELAQLPDVFGKDELAKLYGWNARKARLYINTGVMCVRMNKRAILERLRFSTRNWIRKNDKGEFYPVSEPEDWLFSEDAQEAGLKVMATKAIPLVHLGALGYRNFGNWGTLETDTGDPKE